MDSILNQSFKDIEIILVNDGSTDSSVEILEKYSKQNSNLILINQDNKGQGEARNQGINLSRGKYLWFVDSDDLLEEDAVQFVFNRIEGGNSDGYMFTCKVVDPHLLGENKQRETCFCGFDDDVQEGSYTSKQMLEILLSGKMIPLCWNKVFKREIFVKSNFQFTSGIYFEDLLFNATMFHYGFKMELIRQDLYIYNQHIESTMFKPCTDKHIHSIFVALNETIEFLKRENIYDVNEKHIIGFFWRQITFIYYKFVKDADLEKNKLFLSELSKVTANLPISFFIPGDSDFPFSILMKVMGEYQGINEEMENLIMESFNFSEEFVEQYM